MRNQDKGKKPASENLERSLGALKVFIEEISEKYGIPAEDIINLLGKGRKEGILIPSFIFRERNLGILEAAIKYIKEEYGLTYHKIAVLLHRDDRVVWVTYNNAIKKKKEKFKSAEPNYWLPVSVFTSGDLSPLESISSHLIDCAKFDFDDAAELLNRDSRSIRAFYKKSKEKSK